MIDRVPVITVTQADILCAFLSHPRLGYILHVCFCCFPPSLEQRRELLKHCFDLLFSLCKPLSSPSWYLFTEDLAKLKDRCVFQKIRTPCFPLFSCFPWLQCWKSGRWPLSLISLSLMLLLPRSDFLGMTWNSPCYIPLSFYSLLGTQHKEGTNHAKRGPAAELPSGEAEMTDPSRNCAPSSGTGKKEKGNQIGSISKQNQRVFMN